MQKRWLLKSSPDSDAVDLGASLPPIVTQLLRNRHIRSPEEVARFLKPSLAHLPDPSGLEDMDRSVARIVEAVRSRELITIYGDYDVDGATSTALLVDFFESVGAPVQPYIPHRLKEGYSLNPAALRKIHESGSRLIITVDNGISAVDEAKLARELGIDLIITDHHDLPEVLPEAFSILNPKRSPQGFGKELAGVGVAFYLLIALRRALREAGMLGENEPSLRRALDLVAVGTVADMAPLVGINRILVAEGLKVLSRSPRLGLQVLMRKIGLPDVLRSDHIAFQIAPRINAVGRLEDAAIGLRLLLSQRVEEAESLSEVLNAANSARQQLEDEIVEAAFARIEAEQLHRTRRSLVLYHPDWHLGVVGIVASRLVEKYHLPAIVLSSDENGLKGSARSIRGFNIVEGIRRCSAWVKKFGGHPYAAGLSLDPKCLEGFTQAFDQTVREGLRDEDFIPSLAIDVESPLATIDESLLQQLDLLQPYGLGNPAPVLMVKGVQVQESRLVGERHLRLKVSTANHSFGAIGFRLAEKRPEPSSRVDLAFIPEWNEWNGRRQIQLRIFDLKNT